MKKVATIIAARLDGGQLKDSIFTLKYIAESVQEAHNLLTGLEAELISNVTDCYYYNFFIVEERSVSSWEALSWEQSTQWYAVSKDRQKIKVCRTPKRFKQTCNFV